MQCATFLWNSWIVHRYIYNITCNYLCLLSVADNIISWMIESFAIKPVIDPEKRLVTSPWMKR